MRELATKYTAEVDSIDKKCWYEILKHFTDANIYQSWSYDAIRCGEKNISHLLLKRNGNVVAVAQSRILRTPIINVGIAYVRWGPIWKLYNSTNNKEVFCQILRALRNEYVCRRGLVLRLYPILFDDESDELLPLLQQEGFSHLQTGKHERTLIINLDHSIDHLRKGLHQKWRYNLKLAEKNKLEIIEGYDDELFSLFIGIYRDLINRKKFIQPNDIKEFRLIQKDLPEHYKMKIILCRFEAEICAGAIFSAIGNTGTYLFGATNTIGLKNYGSYLIHWKFIEWLKQNNYTYYDLHGINPETNPGTYRFKKQLCGINGKDVHFLGQFEASNNYFSTLAVKSGNVSMLFIRNTKKTIHNWYKTKK